MNRRHTDKRGLALASAQDIMRQTMRAQAEAQGGVSHQAQSPPQPRDTALNDIAGSLAQLCQRFKDTRWRLSDALDRACGPEPKAAPAGDCVVAPQVSATVAHIHDLLADLDMSAQGLANEADRLDRLV